MPVPTSISELSTTPGSNSPSGSDAPSVLDDHQRTAYAFIRTLSDTKAATADSVLLTGNQTIAGVKTFSSAPVVPDASFGLSKITMATARLLGRTTASTGAPEEITVGTGLTLSAGALTPVTATNAVAGISELSDDAEAQAAAALNRALTPANLAAVLLGIGQTQTNVTGSRSLGVTYTNTTGRTIGVAITASFPSGAGASLTTSGVVVARSAAGGASLESSLFALIRPGDTYILATTAGSPGISTWIELR